MQTITQISYVYKNLLDPILTRIHHLNMKDPSFRVETDSGRPFSMIITIISQSASLRESQERSRLRQMA